MKKHVFVINGSGGVGKDTICGLAARHWRVQNISSITPILDIARSAGWNGDKTPKARRFLSQLKQICTEFNDLPFSYCLEQYHLFLQSDAQILFVHIREPEEIARFCSTVGNDCKTILVRREAMESVRGKLGNRSDDDVEEFVYDFVFCNDYPLDKLPDQVYRFFTEIL